MADLPEIHPREIRASLNLSRVHMARLLDVSAKSIERWERRDQPPASENLRQGLLQLREIVALGHVVYTPEGFSQFLNTPLSCFDGRTALRRIEAGE